MKPSLLCLSLALCACEVSDVPDSVVGRTEATLGAFTITLDRDAVQLAIDGPSEADLTGLSVEVGEGTAEVTMAFGSFTFDEGPTTWSRPAQYGSFNLDDGGLSARVELLDEDGDLMGRLVFSDLGLDNLAVRWVTDEDWLPQADRLPNRDRHARVRWAMDCDTDDHFMGFGAHAMDVDHVGQAFPLWVTEPGIGKTEDEEPTGDPIRGTRHASSYPVPWVLRPHRGQGLAFDVDARVDVDLCKSDPTRWTVETWQGDVDATLIARPEGPLATVAALSDLVGRPTLPPRWAFGPWVDAIRGTARVEDVATDLRTRGVPFTAIWTEDWKGADKLPTGYRLSEEWTLDDSFYPDADLTRELLDDLGIRWMGYFAPFLALDGPTGEDAAAAGVQLMTSDGEPATFIGVNFNTQTQVDLSTSAGRTWASGYLQDAYDLGFRGWMVDYGEWLDPAAALASGQDALRMHNRYPQWWQQTQLDALADRPDHALFCRSGWMGTQGICPIVWAGDQRTSFDTDDGFPTVIALSLGLGASGVGITTHDIAGYQSVGNPPSDQQLWFRWAGLGAYSPVFRTHHGSFDEQNHQFDTNEATLEHLRNMTREHMRLWPYRYALARTYTTQGEPMVRPVAFHHGTDWGRLDAWMLGPSMLVAPVTTRDATTREVDLPALPTGTWYDWHTGSSASSGVVTAGFADTPVFAPHGAIIPTFDLIPDTLVDEVVDTDSLVTFDEADQERVLHIFGGGPGRFEEADRTTYVTTGQATSSAEATQTLVFGDITVGGVTVAITGTVERTYTVRVHR